MSTEKELPPEELKLRPPPKRNKKDDEEVKAPENESRTDVHIMERGPLSPAQYDDDGWGETPVQMRG